MEPRSRSGRPRWGVPRRRPTSAIGEAVAVVATMVLLLGPGASAVVPPAETPRVGGERVSILAEGSSRPASEAAVTALPAAREGAHPGGGSATPRPAWLDITSFSRTQLPVTEDTAGAWDGADGYLLVYGGDGDSGLFDNGWTYRSGNWTRLPSGAPPGVAAGLSLADDPSDGGVVLFGGIQSASPLRYNNSTWIYHGGNWDRVPTAHTPPARYEGSMVYDPSAGGDLLFGGVNLTATTTALNDTWLFRNGSWSRLTAPSAPPPRYAAMMAYDPTLNGVVLFGGARGDNSILDDTWAFSGGSWRPVSTGAASPPGLVAGMMDYDPDLGGVVLTGGVTGGEGVVNGSYEFNGTGWAALSADGAPWAASSGVGAWDPVDHEFVLAGGNETENRTFVLVDPVEITSVAGPRTVDVAENATFVPVLSGGPRPVRYAWTFDGAASATTPNASARFSSVGNRSVGLTVTAPGLPPVHWNGSVLVVPSPSEIVTSEGPATDVGVPDSFGATPVGGLAPFQFAWDFGDGGIANGTTAAHAWDEPGFYVVRARVTDAAGEASLNGVDVEVNATPSAAIAVGGYTFQPAEVGVPEPLLLGVTGGTPPFAANWSIGTVPLATGLSPAVRFPSPGNVVVTAFVGDAVGVNCSSTAPVNVAPAVTVSIAGPTTAPGGGGTWTAEVVGGVAPYQVRWSAPGNPVRTGDSAMLSFGSAGTYPVRVEVLDRAGGEASASTNVTVPASGSVGWGSLVGNLPVDLGVAAVGVAALVVLLAVRRRPASRRPEKFPRR